MEEKYVVRKKKDKPKKPMSSLLKSIEKMDSSVERRMLIASIVSDEFNEAISPNRQKMAELIPSKSSKTIFNWAGGFFDKYGKAIKHSLATLFEEHEEKLDGEVSSDIKDVLSAISKQHQHADFNHEYELDAVKDWMDALHVSAFNVEVESLRELDRHDEAIRLVESFERIAWDSESHEFDPHSEELIEKAINEKKEPLFDLGGDLGKFFGNTLARKQFCIGIAPQKVGKSFLLSMVSDSASLAGLNVMNVQAGDLSDIDCTARTIVGTTNTPIDGSECGERYIPVIDCVENQKGRCGLACPQSVYIIDADGRDVMLEPEDIPSYIPCNRCQYDKECSDRLGKKFIGSIWKKKIEVGERFEDRHIGVTVDEALEGSRKYLRRRKGDNRHYVFSNGELYPQKLKSLIIERRKKGFPVDVVILDYADILSCNPEDKRLNKYDQITKVYEGLRAIAMDEDCLIFTVSQSNAESALHPVLSRNSFSDNKKKLDLGTFVFGLQRTIADSKFMCVRLQQIISRSQAMDDGQIVMLQDIGTGRLNINNYFANMDDLIEYHPAFYAIKKERDEKEENDSNRGRD